MADVPKDLLQEIKRLEELFTVDKTKLKAITDHFVSELTKGWNSGKFRVISTNTHQVLPLKVAAS
jgi:hexokinase